jgi:hypothetical protein
MRQEYKEYNFDWMVWRLFESASRACDGSLKEYQNLMKYIPSFRGAIEPILEYPEVGSAFLKAASTYLENINTARDRGKKVAASTFCFSPAILYAMDVVPITFELLTVMGTFLWKHGTAEYLDYCCEIGFTETSCSSQRGSLGAYLSGNGVDIDFFLNDAPGVCDTYANAFAFGAAYLDKPFYQLNMPSDLTSPRSLEYHREDFKELISFIENQTGKKLDPDHLKEILEEVEIQDEICDELEELQMLKPNPTPVLFQFFIYATRFLFSGAKEGTEVLRLILNHVKKNADLGVSGLRHKKENLRALFCYIDHYTSNFRLWEMFEDLGITQVGNILSRQWDNKSPLAKVDGKEEESYIIDTSSLDYMI